MKKAFFVDFSNAILISGEKISFEVRDINAHSTRSESSPFEVVAHDVLNIGITLGFKIR